ncbi:hypothetical protein EVG20_g2862 [Dentipellis fragilis]|uniref:Uncharacterized protein n=1 Tax=Dentipellis fragilis TaxID=205917 RepID=A0A4Y9Z6I8_9AGAM|nr:hypothetical protein EVG20_g2862 [Dentipellis fragilis]
MAILAPQDWHPPRDHAMDAPSANSVNATVARPRASPVNDHSPSPSPITPSQGQPYPYPVQQQQAGWNAQSQQYYPVFYQNPHQPQYPMHPGHPQQAQIPQQNPYYDPNAQFAHWAYQQMMFNAQQQGHSMPHVPQASAPLSQRGRSASASSPGDYFAQNQIPGFASFPSGTPPPHPSQLPASYRGAPNNNQPQYDGFHPYRRPNQRQGSHSTEPSSNSANEWRPPGPFQPPYARADAAGSSTSVNSTGSNGRPRTSSLQGSNNGHGGSPHHHYPSSASSQGSVRSRSGAPPPQTSSSSNGRGNSSPSAPAGPPSLKPHHRTSSTSSSNSAAGARPSASSGSAASSSSHAVPRPARPSPLSQGNITAPEKRMSRDDSDLAAMLEPIPNQSMLRSGGLKGRLRRALSLSAAQAMQEEENDDAGAARRPSDARMPSGLASGWQQTKKKSRTALFNSRINASTDNISLSSTMSSASVVIRKLGSIGKLARRNSLAGITSLFKDKKEKDETDGGGGKKGKKKKGEKGDVSEASVSMATVELDRSSSEWNAELNGLTPAAKLARQHTLKTNAEAAAKVKAQEEAAAAARTAELPTTWEKNTTTRQGDSPARGGMYRVNEDGMRVIVEDDNSGSDSDHDYSAHLDGWDDEDWSRVDGDEDVTIRQGLERASIGDDSDDTPEPWATGIRRSVERNLVPAKGILKNAVNYDQRAFIDASSANFNRTRSNSYNSPAVQHSELGPLARMPSPDPDHIDGLHRHPSHSSAHSPANNNGTSNSDGSSTTTSFLPPLPFETGAERSDSPAHASGPEDSPRPGPEKTLFNHPNLNSSAPVLSALANNPPTLSHRSATTPAKRLAFASNLSVYDTFPPTVYDRRSEPATWSRLTPALAQRIKEELNSFKMEEMEVHAASRIQYVSIFSFHHALSRADADLAFSLSTQFFV